MTTKNETNLQFNSVSKGYVAVSGSDPIKRFVQYPEALRLVGNVYGKQVLDIGCGNGMHTRMMARLGADVTAYDPSEELIKTAQDEELEYRLGIEYSVAEKPAFSSAGKFDIVTSIMVLCAADREQMKNIFHYAHIMLKKGGILKRGGKFIVITLNPDFKRFGELHYNRRFTLRNDGKIGIEFFDSDGTFSFSIIDSSFLKADIEEAAKAAGFKSLAWKKMRISKEGIKWQGKEFWKDFERDCPYIGLVATKK